MHTLNQAQQKAVLHRTGPLLILAGAGAGKTKTITHRIAQLIESGVSGKNILAITFTNKAAHEMRHRVHQLLKDTHSEEPLLCTFHSLGVRILREHGSAIGIEKNFSIADEGDALSYIKEALRIKGYDAKEWDPKKIRSVISKQKGNGVEWETFRNTAEYSFDRVVSLIWETYERLLKKEHAVDFDDLLSKTVSLLKTHKAIRDIYHERYQYIHVDEYQDTNDIQYQLIQLLAEKYRNLCVVGDGDQTIYTWRGANMKNILRFEEDYPDAQVVILEENYRSSSVILEAANAVIKNNLERKDKTLRSTLPGGEKISLCEAYDEQAEAAYVIDTITGLLDTGVPPEKIAVLYRANFQSRIFEEACLVSHLPYELVGTKFFERKEVKEVLSYIRAAYNREGGNDIRRIINIPARGVGKVTITKLFEQGLTTLPKTMQTKLSTFFSQLDTLLLFMQEHTASESIRYAIEVTGIAQMYADQHEDERVENIQELVTVATRYDHLPFPEWVERLTEDAALESDQDTMKKNGVRLMTIHAAKGLEFAHVFIVGLEQDIFPSNKGGEQSAAALEEERRLFYVALTRAEKKVHLSYATIRTIYGMRQIQTPSLFIYEIPETLVERGIGGKVIYLD